MTKQEMLSLIDSHKNKLIDPVEMLQWTWIRVFILKTTDAEFDAIMGRAVVTLSR